MARKPRIEFPGALYHVIARGNNRQKIFTCEKDYEHFLFRLQQAKKRFKLILYAYALMPNHFHLLIETGEIPLSKIMQSLQLNYTQYFNRKNKRVGHLFQGRYKAILCQKESYLKELVRYIILNPIRAGLARRLTEWPWSSYLETIDLKDAEIVSTNDVLGLFGSRHKAAVFSFQKFINDGKREGHKKEYYTLKDQRILGEEEFAEDIIKNSENDFEYRKISFREVVDIVAKQTGIAYSQILSTTNERNGVKGRCMVAYICRNIAGFKAKEVGRQFRRSQSSISKLIHRAEKDIMNDGPQKQVLATIEDDIKKHYRPCIVRQLDEK
ncbi:MAG: addiction module toxin RelE [Deltaproteobacteria bacterium CG11_big_fil_rev_8_21_14_0_20_49_13]|nr:MAG: addiction module toxin RelE [Deltaproteobacteria bacterium CG11_big_fil_rev_8_21_14_0_20_49_13]